MRRHARSLTASAITAALVLALLVVVAGALHPPGRTLPSGWELLWTVELTGSAFARAWDLGDLGPKLANSLLVVLVAVPASLLFAGWAAFAMVRLDDRPRRLAVGLTLVLLVVPGSALWVPRFLGFAELGLVDSKVPLVAPALIGTTPFAVLLLFWSYRRVPAELVDAARLEGLGPLSTWWRVVVPLTEASTAAAAMVVFVAHWSSFVEPLLYLYAPGGQTLPLGVGRLRLLGLGDTPTVLAGALAMMGPALLAFALAQRHLLSATRGARWLAAR